MEKEKIILRLFEIEAWIDFMEQAEYKDNEYTKKEIKKLKTEYTRLNNKLKERRED